MGLFDIFNKKESLITLDIGSTGIKLLEFDISKEKPLLVNLGIAPVAGDIFSGNALSNTEKVAEQINGLLEANNISGKRVVISMPGPGVISKRIRMPQQSLSELSASIQYEAGNFIPHGIESVRLDFHILGELDSNQLEVLVVAVKNEVLESFIEALSLVGLEAAVADVDYFALQNMYELSMPENLDKTVALLNIGARYTTVSLCRNGTNLFSGDIAVGGNAFTAQIADELGISEAEAEQLKRTMHEGGEQAGQVQAIIDNKVEFVVGEISHQLGLFWDSTGREGGIDQIYLCGGGALTPGLLEELSEKTGVVCERIDPFLGVNCGTTIEAEFLKEVAPYMGIAVGMGIRQPGDRDLSGAGY